MTKPKKHSWLKWSAGLWAGFNGVKYLFTHPHFIRDFKKATNEYSTTLQELIESYKRFKTNTVQLQIELKATEKTIGRINKSINRFQYKLQPRIEKINELQSNITTELTDMGEKISSKNRR